MPFEQPNREENIPSLKLEVEPSFSSFIPDEFKQDPFGYFEQFGTNIKSGEVERDAEGKIKEDPTATKDLPVWKNGQGQELWTVGKRVNTEKSHVGKSGDPFYEYTVMEIAHEFNLPAPKPIAKAEKENEHLIIMEKVPGIRWTTESMRQIHESNLTEADKQDMLTQAEQLIAELKEKYEEIGLIRTWKMKDMIADVDIPNKRVRSLVPTDWERTKIDQTKLTLARQKKILE